MLRFSILLLILDLCEATNLPSCTPDNKKNGKCESVEEEYKSFDGILTPLDLPKPRIFTDWDNSTISLPLNPNQVLAKGSMNQNKAVSSKTSQFAANFSVLHEAISRETVGEILSILRFGNVSKDFEPEEIQMNGEIAVELDFDPDSVDSMPTQEIYLDNPSLRQGLGSKPGDTHPDDFGEKRRLLRRQIRERLDPILDGILTPFIRSRYPEHCMKGEGRNCIPCYSLIRRYRVGERISHAPHHDTQSLVTVVVSFSDYDREYTGGLYVSSDNVRPYFIRLNRGDAIVHQGDLFHGVEVLENKNLSQDHVPERWSWILWYHDSDTCKMEYRNEWFKSCAEEGNPNCQLLHSDALGAEHESFWELTESSCKNGQLVSCVKIAQHHMMQPDAYEYKSPYEFNPMKAQEWFERSIGDPYGHYGLAIMSLYLLAISTEGKAVESNHPLILNALGHLQEAALRQFPFAMFNLGIAHHFGYGYTNGGRNPVLAADWFETCGLPEGYVLKAQFLESIGEKKDAKEFQKRAVSLGYGKPWRREKRDHTFGGVLNLFWPPLPNGIQPPRF